MNELHLKLSDEEIAQHVTEMIDGSGPLPTAKEMARGVADAATAKAAWACVDFIEKFLDGKGDVFKPSEELARELRGESIQKPTSE